MRRRPGTAAVSALVVGTLLSTLFLGAGIAPAGLPPEATPIDETLLKIVKPRRNATVNASSGRAVAISASCTDPCWVRGRIRIQVGSKRQSIPFEKPVSSSESPYPFSVEVTLTPRFQKLLTRKPRTKKAWLRAVITAEVREGSLPVRTDTDARTLRLR